MHSPTKITSVVAQKNRLKRQKEKSRVAARFTADDIVRAIEAVQQGGLTVHAVEIAVNGSIRINTTSPFRHRAPSKPETGADAQDETQPNKRRA
jgi:hypothetical protein